MQLFTLAERETLDAIDWYLEDKRSKRTASRLLRAGAIVFGSAGGIFPLVVRSPTEVNWGYLLLGLAGLCLAFDKFFGLSSAWMRDMATVNGLRLALTNFQHEWTAATLTAANGDSASIRSRLAMLHAFARTLPEQIGRETATWSGEFSSLLGQFDLSRLPASSNQVVGRRGTASAGPDQGSPD